MTLPKPAARIALDPDTVPAVALGVLLSTLPRDHPLVAAARLGITIGDSRDGVPLVADYPFPDGRYHRPNALPEYCELAKRRYPPTGDRDQWIKPKPGDHRGQRAMPEVAA
ncbi:hypothetical protein [Pseudonocardia adelaidensis]|uniref:Uncharacterized protein n=1 Tax=Pseudonocardia adelaidensis TaxID=648754 RepID=A0ABP9NRP1_9PSEU